MITRIEVKKVNKESWMTAYAAELVDKFNHSKNTLYLDVFEDYQSRSLDDIMEEGMYSYSFKNDDALSREFMEMVEEAGDRARFLNFYEENLEVA